MILAWVESLEVNNGKWIALPDNRILFLARRQRLDIRCGEIEG